MESQAAETAVVAQPSTSQSPAKPTKLPANPLELLDKEEIEEIMQVRVQCSVYFQNFEICLGD